MRGKTCLEDKKSCGARTQMSGKARGKDRRQSRRNEGREGERPERDRLMGKRQAKRDAE